MGGEERGGGREGSRKGGGDEGGRKIEGGNEEKGRVGRG